MFHPQGGCARDVLGFPTPFMAFTKKGALLTSRTMTEPLSATLTGKDIGRAAVVASHHSRSFLTPGMGTGYLP